MATITKKTVFAGVGCLIQFIGFNLLFVFPVGTFFGLMLLVYGSLKSIRLICSECGNKIDSKDVKICPTCRASFE